MKRLISRIYSPYTLVAVMAIVALAGIIGFVVERRKRKNWQHYAQVLQAAPVAPRVALDITSRPPTKATMTKSAASDAGATNGAENATPTSSGLPPIETYAQYLHKLRDETRAVLDLPPEQWSATAIEYMDFKQPKLPSSVTPAPKQASVKELQQQYPLVRPLPYPFYRGLSIPSDCCGSALQDYFYTHTLLARRYGLDLPSSFWGSTMNLIGHRMGMPAVFANQAYAPRSAPLQIEGRDIDCWPFILTSYYRGWIDHLHAWSDDASAGFSVVTPTTLKLTTDGRQQITLERPKDVMYPFRGFVLDIESTGDIQSWEIELTDKIGLKHLICWGGSLGDRQGWDVSGKSAEELRYTVLSLDQESNRSDLRVFGGRADDAVPIAGAVLRVSGKAGAAVKLNRLRNYHLTRAEVQEQLALLRQFNILPSVSSFHGGSSGWSVPVYSLPWKAKVTTTDGRTYEEEIERDGEAGDPRSPSYHTDLLAAAGIDFYEQNLYLDKPATDGPMMIGQSKDGLKFWETSKTFRSNEKGVIPRHSPYLVHFEGLGNQIGTYLETAPQFGLSESFYTHYNRINPCALKDQTEVRQMFEVKKLSPENEEALKLLSNAHYNWTGDLKWHQRVWCVPTGVRMRYFRSLASLAKQATLEGNTVRIQPWIDEASGRELPDREFPTLDLHGQTFYVPDAQKGRVFIGERELRTLKRNPKDHTGRESVTIIDTTMPTRVFDELDLYESSGRLFSEHGSYFHRASHAYHGRHSLQLWANDTGESQIRWEPWRLDNHETQFLRFAYRKNDQQSKFELSWTLFDGTETVVTDGDLRGRQGWRIPPVSDDQYHEVVVDFADMQPGQDGKKLPRGEIAAVKFAFQKAKAGASIWFDSVEFLAARGVRPATGQGRVVGGRIDPQRDGEIVQLRIGAQVRKTHTSRGGWYMFTDVPVNSIAEIVWEHADLPHFPLQGRLLEVSRNCLEYHIFAGDDRNPVVPRPKDYAGQQLTETMGQRFGPGDSPSKECAALYAPHGQLYYAGLPNLKSSYLIEDWANNYGWIDKDRDEKNVDGAIRICMQGECWTEGRQAFTGQQMNVVLESMLRHKLGVPVEVIKDGTSSSSPASYADRFDRYAIRFRPDLVIMFVNPFNMAHMEPTMFTRLFGWPKDHSPYRMYDFDAQGKLVEYPADPGYGAFQIPADNKPLIGAVPMFQTYAIAGATHPLADRTFDLLRGVLRDPYQKKLAAYGGKVGLVYGYCLSLPLGHAWWNDNAVVAERWRQRVADFCRDNQVIGLDLTNHLQNERARSVLIYEHDAHPTPMGHYLIAAALCDELVKLPELQKLADARRSQSEESSATLPLTHVLKPTAASVSR